MSHYTVLAIVPAAKVAEADGDLEAVIDAMMAPYSEDLDWEPYRVHLTDTEVADMASYYHIDPTNLSALAEKMEAWQGGQGGVDDAGLYRISTWNNDSTWDWFEIGGRWAGSMRAKTDASTSDLVWSDRFNQDVIATLEQEGSIKASFDAKGRLLAIYCDGGRKRALALDEMRDIAGDKKRESFVKLRAIIDQHGPMPPSLREANLNDLPEEERQAIVNAYWAHPTIAAMRDAQLYGFMEFPDEVFSSDNEQIEVERAKAGAIPGYATLTKDGWLTPGRMGWFGVSHDTANSKGHYWEAANAAIDAAADDDYLVYLDAHV